MIRKALFFFLVLILLAVPAAADDSPPTVSARAFILVHPDSGRVLYAENADSRMLIASTTKLMTALVASQCLSPDRTATVKEEWTDVEGSAMYLRPGETYTVRELLEGLLLASGNDAALALSEIAAGSTEAFVERMNSKARAMGLENTHFDNPHGLDSPGQYSTAADLAVIMGAACRDPLLCEIMGLRARCVRGLTYENHNKLLGRCPGVFAGKTGYTKAAGRCLVSCCEREGMELICVTLNDPDDWRDHKALYDWAYSVYREVPLGQDVPEIPVIAGEKDTLTPALEREIRLCLKKDESCTVRYSLTPFVFAPVKKGESVGELAAEFADGAVFCLPLYCTAAVDSADNAGKVCREIVDRFIGIYAG